MLIQSYCVSLVSHVNANSTDDGLMSGHDTTYTGYSAITGSSTNVTQLWNYTVSGSVLDPPVVRGGYVYVSSSFLQSSWNSTVYCFNASTGVKVWSYTTTDPPEGRVLLLLWLVATFT